MSEDLQFTYFVCKIMTHYRPQVGTVLIDCGSRTPAFTRSLSMYAVIFCGGKQHKVSEGDVLSVELLDAQAGSDIELDKVLLVSDGTNIKVGAPYLDGAKVTAKVLGAHGGEKVKIVKFRRRKHHQKVTGHRQWFTDLQITGIQQ